jgi:DNA mismatch repair protein MutL
MSIAILPARLANQIAAGEVVERPASVVKELVENSLDAGATKLHIDIEKGGSKRIRIIDNGAGIVKDELYLALSRHATSKIKNLDDLESIASLGFRGEALASISAVARLTLTSKPKSQSSAWQACAQGRDMDVTVQPAAHPDGTTIDVQDLFFNTPARRKFLRTDKTEFTHIDEVIRRIALARFDVAITLTHNGKIIRQYQGLGNKTQYSKRVAKICGQKFIDHALTIDCQHDDLHLWGWVGLPDFVRNQNDLAYSYVNGRMMRDKLINHAIRQAYADLLPNEGYPAFVLYLALDHREVDVNVHPAKHEVRFHQGRYIHDFIYSVIHRAFNENSDHVTQQDVVQAQHHSVNYDEQQQHSRQNSTVKRDFVTPLRKVHDAAQVSYNSSYQQNEQQKSNPSRDSVNAYQKLLTPIDLGNEEQAFAGVVKQNIKSDTLQLHTIFQQHYLLFSLEETLRILDVVVLATAVTQQQLLDRWQEGLVSQPLLLPQQIQLTEQEVNWLTAQRDLLAQAGIVLRIKSKTSVQIQEFPACLKQQDVTTAFSCLVKKLMATAEKLLLNKQYLSAQDYCKNLAELSVVQQYNLTMAILLFEKAQNIFKEEFNHYLCLNSVEVDLTSSIVKLNS